MNGLNPPADSQVNQANTVVDLTSRENVDLRISPESLNSVSGSNTQIPPSIHSSVTIAPSQGNNATSSVIPPRSTSVIPSPSVNQITQAATSVSTSQPVKSVVTDRVNPDSFKNLDSRSRSYELKEFMKNGWLNAVTSMFKSVDIATQNVTKDRNGKFNRSLYLHFNDDDPELAGRDFQNSEQFTLEFNNLCYNLKAHPVDETDGRGTIIPRIIKQAII